MNNDGSAGYIKLAKHEGNGNDFLVCIDLDDAVHLEPRAISWLCDRQRGIGADGFIRVLRQSSGADAYMELTNADGTRAEMSGNGIRCLVQALYLSGRFDDDHLQGDIIGVAGSSTAAAPTEAPAVYRIATDAGMRDVSYFAGGDRWLGSASVDMGDVMATEALPIDRAVLAKLTDRMPFWVDAGNPHLVLFGGEAREGELERIAPQSASLVSGGANVELCWLEAAGVHDGGAYGYAVYERGVGPTLSCGTGAVAVGAVAKYIQERPGTGPGARARGTDDRDGCEVVSMTLTSTGGPLEVSFNGNAATLAGPVSKVADMYIDPGRLAGTGAFRS
ncbi:MAG: diaminopimelate epimerase [Acidimicrobiales bacterium]